MSDQNELKIALALGGGAFRGLAHIGVLEVFEKENIKISAIAGTSIGSVVGALYACGMTTEEMMDLAEHLQEKQYYDLTIPRIGLLQGKKVENLIAELTEEKRFDETKIPLAITACDFEKMEAVYIREGVIHEAVRASISIPGIFVPVEREGRMLVDGGLVNRIPAAAAREMGADVVIGVDVGYRGHNRKPANLIEMVLYTFEAMEWQINRVQEKQADYLITPHLEDVDPAHIGQTPLETIQRGREAAQKAMEEIKALLESKKKRTA